MRNLWYTGYVVSSLTLLALAYVEWEVPGFVSSVFPLYVVMIMAIICGLGALLVDAKFSRGGRAPAVLALAIGVLASLMVFRAADVFGAYRLMMAIVTLGLPLLLLKALSDAKE